MVVPAALGTPVTRAALLLTAVLVGVPIAASETRALIVAGLGGEPDYELAFQRQARTGAAALGTIADDVTLLLGKMATAERLREAFGELKARAGAQDAIVLVLIGHGSFDDRDYRFNIPGPDVTGTDLDAWLNDIGGGQQLVVVATSGSGALQAVLAAPDRTVMTATRSGAERNVTVFSRFFVAALEAAAADLDKDGLVSAAEAFQYAEANLLAHYADRNLMATEHPTLSGPEPMLALGRLPGAEPIAPAVGVADERMRALERDIEALRESKDDYDADIYYARLQQLLLELAVLRRRNNGEGGS